MNSIDQQLECLSNSEQANPTVWPTNGLPTYFRSTHEQQSPSTPYSLVEVKSHIRHDM